MPRNLTGNTAPTTGADAEARAAKWADAKVCARALLTPQGYSGFDPPPRRNWGDPPAPALPVEPALAAKLAELRACAEALVSRRPWVIGPSRRTLRRIVAANVQEGANSSALPAGWQRIGLGYDAAGNPVDPAKAARWADPKVCAQALFSRDSAGPYVPPVKRAPAAGGRGQDGAGRPMDADRAARWSDPQICAQVLLSPGSSPPPPPPEAPAADPAEVLERNWNPDLHPRGGYAQNRGWFSRAFGRGGRLARRRGQAATTSPMPQGIGGQRSNSTATPPSRGAKAQNTPSASGSPDEQFVEQPVSNGPRISLVSHTGGPRPTNLIHVHRHLIREVNGKQYVYFQRKEGGDWFVVELTRVPVIDKNGNLVVDTMTGKPRTSIDVTGAKKVDALTAFELNHPTDVGWLAIAKHYAKKYAPIDPDSLSEDMAKSGEVGIPLLKYGAKSVGVGLATAIGGNLAKTAIGKAVGALKSIGKKAAKETATTANLTAARGKGGANPTVRHAASRGSMLHSDKPGNLPEQLRKRFPETKFEFTKPGTKGQDVKVIGGKHPAEYPDSAWPKGVDHADFKPNTPGGTKTFQSDQRSKWSQPTHRLPYDPETGELK